MRLLFAIKSLAVPGGGAERVLAEVASGLCARGHAVGIVTFDAPKAESFYPLDLSIERYGISIGTPGHPTPRTQLPTGLMRLRSAVTGWAPDVTVGFMHSTYVPLAMALLGSPSRLVASEHAGLSHFKDRIVERLLVSAVWRSFIAATVPSETMWASMPERLRSITHILPNPVDLVQFSNAGPCPEPCDPIILCVGRFMEEKDHATLLRAFAQVSPQFPSWRLRLVGDGVLRSSIVELAAGLDIGEKVEMPGVVGRIATEYRRASIVAVPSLYESFGLCVAEALASRRPVVGFSDCLGSLGIAVDGVNSILVEGNGDRVENLSRGLALLMANPALRSSLGEGGPDSVRRFDHDVVLGEWEDFLMDISTR